MPTLPDLIPQVEILLAMEPEELAPYVLKVAKGRVQNGIFTRDSIFEAPVGHGFAAVNQFVYPQKAAEATLAIGEAWAWLVANAMVVQDTGINGTHGFYRISRRGHQVDDPSDFAAFQAAAAFPKKLLHPVIADRAWLLIARGDLSDAVFTSFRSVEEAVRRAGGFQDVDVGTDLMRRAFHKDNGPLTDKSHPEAEREALAHLFAGAIGSYKNPHSHRTVTISDPREAQQMVLLASHLLSIVEARARAATAAASR